MNLNDIKTIIESYNFVPLDNLDFPNTGFNYYDIEIDSYEPQELLTSNTEIGVYNIIIKLFFHNNTFQDYVDNLEKINNIINAISLASGYAGLEGYSYKKLEEEPNKSLATINLLWRF